jgi:hypothetical protein
MLTAITQSKLFIDERLMLVANWLDWEMINTHNLSQTRAVKLVIQV